MSSPSRTSRQGLRRVDLQQQARLRALAVAASAAGSAWMVEAFREASAAPEASAVMRDGREALRVDARGTLTA